MYNVFEKLLEERGVTAYRVAKDTGIGTATLTNWKNGKYTPKQDKMQKIADYFNVSLAYLTTGHEDDSLNSENNKSLNHLSGTEKDLIVLFRKAGDISEDEATALKKQFESTIDIYLKAKGIKVDD